jgi:hypothetical protein
MDLKNLFNKGKKIVDERGGVESLKEDAEELKGIATSKGSLADKAKEAAAAVKDPGSPGGEVGGQGHQGGGQHEGGGQHPGQGQHQGGGQHQGQGQGQHNPGQGGQHKPGQRPNQP